MPYIKRDQRGQLDDTLNELTHKLRLMSVEHGRDALKGIINYSFTKILHCLYNSPGRDMKPGHKQLDALSYSNINDVIGILECIKQEFYIDVARPYEDEKKKENGPVVIS